MPERKVHIIGVAPEGVSSLLPEARHLLDRAEVVFGGRRLLDMFPSLTGKKIAIRTNLGEVTNVIKRKLGRNVLDIIPNVSAMQLAFARIKESWEDATFVSVHSRPVEDIVGVVGSNAKLGIFTDGKHTPANIARVLLEHGVDGYRAYVCQNLGSKDEKVIKTNLPNLVKMKFSPLNVLILLREQSKRQSQQIFGIPEASFHRRDGLITKQELRAVSLAKMRLTENSVVWDIGAGSGAVSIEASFLARRGHVYAIEKNQKDVAIIKKNLRKFNVPNVEVVQTFAPDGLDKLPDPTAVFIGGSGGRMEEILDFVSRRLKPGGRIVINIVALENLNAAVNALKARGFVSDVSLINIARSTSVMELTRFEALNPVFIVTGVRGKGGIT
jgi:precorrin-6Y C5,15-methyltransferase (decarboxylating)